MHRIVCSVPPISLLDESSVVGGFVKHLVDNSAEPVSHSSTQNQSVNHSFAFDQSLGNSASQPAPSSGLDN